MAQMDISPARQAIVREFNGAGRPPKRASRFPGSAESPADRAVIHAFAATATPA